MPLQKESFIVQQNDLVKSVDVDGAGDGRSVPVNMNFTETSYLSKDTGCSLYGATETSIAHSPFYYKKKSGTAYIIRFLGTKMQTYNTTTLLWADTASSPTFTADAYVGYVVYEDNLWFGNAVESLYKWDGSTFTAYASAPKGNNLEIFEDRLCVSGVTAEPLSLYYSKIADPTDFTVGTGVNGGVVKPLGTDSIVGQKNYYGQLLIFKEKTIWKLTFIYDSVVTLFVPKLELQSGNYGACSRKAVTWVENDIWFFTGREVRAIGYKDQQTGILGVNQSVISDQIKDTLYTLATSDYSKVSTFYNNRRFYLSIPLDASTNDTIFVCHLLYNSSWTKYYNRIKAQAIDFMSIDNVMYSAKSVTPYGILKWDESLLNDNSVAISSIVTFKKVEDDDFNRYAFYRYLDVMFKNLEGRIIVTVAQDAYDLRTTKTKTFYIGQALEDMGATTGEVPFGQKLYGDGYGEDVTGSPFQKKRISFLVKAQTITISIANSSLSETFTVCQYILSGFKQSRRLAKPSNIISIR